MAHTYILYSKTLNKYYVGSTRENPDDRLSKHLSNHHGFTAKAKDWIIVRVEFYQDYYLALQRELQIKSWKIKKMIESLIESV